MTQRIAAWGRLLMVPAGVDPFLVHLPPGVWRRVALASVAMALAIVIVMWDTVAHLQSVPD